MSYQPPADYHRKPLRSGTPGLGAGITSIVCAVLSPVSAVVSIPLGIAAFASSVSRFNQGNDAWWVGALAFAAVAVLLAIVSMVSGLFAVFRSGRLNAGRITGIVGLSIMAVNVFGVAFLLILLLGSSQGT
ncbi:hypothetical protein AAHB33_16990 [Paenarthrobacter sp. S56]|uniref:hypothetical protein n=1 Tax=Paenarthrobacter sp. S56 TaxID=3138179 RepID=UPI00321A7368